MWMEQLEEYVRRPMRQESTTTREGKYTQDGRSPNYGVRDGDSARHSSHVTKLEVTETKMCRWACGHTLRDHVRNENIKEGLKVESIAERCRKARLRWFGHVKMRDHDYVGRNTLEMVPPGRRNRGRPRQRWMDCVNRYMRAIGTTKDEIHVRTGWRRIVWPVHSTHHTTKHH